MFEAFQIGPFLIRSYIVFLLLGVIVSVELFLRIMQKEGLRMTLFLQKGVWFIISFLFFGRLFAILLLYRVYLQDPLRTFVIWDGEFSVIGGCIGIVVALFFCTLRERHTFLAWLDAFIPPMTLLFSLDWFGRFLGALSYGKPTNAPWGVILESMSVRYTVPVHPVQLYYALWFFCLTILLLMFHRRRFAQRMQMNGNGSGLGMPTLLGVFLGCVGVLFLEYYRGDFAVTIFAKLTDFVFLGLLFMSMGTLTVLERKISHRYSLMNGAAVGIGTVAYLLLRPLITVASVEWRFSQFLAVLAILATVVYVYAYRWKYPQH
ncbi:MAG TPA: prolipoprotein diacylglyceryl transferase family protein [Candidatus Peribacterales bacterium]|nr:prolipoprotein diacylglyceryl transferase family protein [Candidatus Peribacterales bacterium]